jgi:hypothetical protein
MDKIREWKYLDTGYQYICYYGDDDDIKPFVEDELDQQIKITIDEYREKNKTKILDFEIQINKYNYNESYENEKMSNFERHLLKNMIDDERIIVGKIKVREMLTINNNKRV